MTDDQPSQPLTGYELDNIEGRWSRYVALRDPDSMETSVHDVPDLLAEVDRLRSALTALARNEQAAANRSLELQEENSALLRKLEEQYQLRAEIATVGSADRSEMLNDLQWYITDIGPEHWQNCDIGDEDCYLCAAHVAIRDRWKGVE